MTHVKVTNPLKMGSEVYPVPEQGEYYQHEFTEEIYMVVRIPSSELCSKRYMLYNIVSGKQGKGSGYFAHPAEDIGGVFGGERKSFRLIDNVEFKHS